MYVTKVALFVYELFLWPSRVAYRGW